MRSHLLVSSLALTLAVFAPRGHAQSPPTPSPATDQAAQVRDLFTRYCTECHGPQLARPKGKFGYVTDLARLVTDGHITPGNVQDSTLFELLTLDDPKSRMPPPSAKAGPLTAEQIDLVKAWILAGAPPSPPAPAAATESTPPNGPGSATAPKPPGPTTPPTPRPFADRLWSFGGKFHPVVVHFPIALLLVGALAEVFVMLGGAWAKGAARLCVTLGGISAVVATVLGLLSASYEGFADATIWTHRLLGIIASVLGLTAAGLQVTGKTTLYRGCLFAAALLTSIAAHFGGIIVHGEDHFTF